MGTNLKTEKYIIITKPFMSPKNYATSLKVVVATWNRHGMHSHAGAWERGNKYRQKGEQINLRNHTA